VKDKLLPLLVKVTLDLCLAVRGSYWRSVVGFGIDRKMTELHGSAEAAFVVCEVAVFDAVKPD
jgi:hypothetical protein